MNFAFPLLLVFVGVGNQGHSQRVVAFTGISPLARPFGLHKKLSCQKWIATTSPVLFATPPSGSEFQADAENQVTRYNAQDFTDAKFEAIKLNVIALENFERELNEYSNALPSGEARDRVISLLAITRYQLKILRDRTSDAVKFVERVADIDYEIKTTMLFRHDYDMLRARIDKLFGWYDEKDIYLAPCFPMVQSSGTGKTKLLYEYTQDHIDTTLLILCVKEEIEQNSRLRKVFNDTLLVPSDNCGSHSERDRVRDKLNALVKDFNNETKKVVLLFDEAQSLLEADQGFFFRVIRWWLRGNKSGKRIVALFTGTSTRLANFFREDPVQSKFSRDAKFVYNEGTKLYKPFYELNTFGLDKHRLYRMSPEEKQKLADLHRAAFFGRPLFARLTASGTLDQALDAIKSRMIMGKPLSRHMTDAACLSVLGSRVQMGQTSIQIASDLVAGGYACLTKASSEKTDSAYVTFFPDPVPAYLAMTLMMDNDPMKVGKSLPPAFWTTRAIGIFSSGLCRPNRGDVGEVAASLYLLFSGDAVRLAVDNSLKTLAVPVSDVLQVAAEPNELYTPQAEASGETCSNVGIPYISFIQVCQNYLFYNLAELTTKKYLEEWFTAGLAFYQYPDGPGYDIIAPIRIEIDNQTKFYPMLITVKNRVDSATKLREGYFRGTTAAFGSMDEKVGISVLVEIGLSKATLADDASLNGDSRESIADKLRDWKADGILEIVIVVPEDDCFGCWEMAAEASTTGGKAAEIYSSHFLAHQTAWPGSETPGDLLRKTKDNEVKPKLNNLIEAYRILGDLSNRSDTDT